MNEKIHVLLIEDNAVDARLVEGMLEHDESGIFELKHASTLEEGLRLLAPHCVYRVILLDLGLPDVNGLQTLRRIMPAAEGASVVVLTGLQDEALGIAALRVGRPRLHHQRPDTRRPIAKNPSLRRRAPETGR